MSTFTARELGTVLSLSREAASIEDLAAFREQIIPGLRRLIPSDTLGYNEIDLESRRAVTITDAPAYDGIDRRFLELAHQHPLVPHQRAGDPRARMISDFLPPRAFHRLELYADIYRPLGIEHQLAFGLSREGIVSVNLGRGRRPFTERERSLAELLRPHLTLAFARARERSSIRSLHEGAEAELERRHTAILHVSGQEIVAAAGPAEDLMCSYFGPAPGGRLPATLGAGIGRLGLRCSDPLIFHAPRGRLRVRVAPGAEIGLRTLILDERRSVLPGLDQLAALGLTPRQTQVLRLLAAGKPNAAIAAELGISTATVSKHLERIYGRLGVRTRTQALALVGRAEALPIAGSEA